MSKISNFNASPGIDSALRTPLFGDVPQHRLPGVRYLPSARLRSLSQQQQQQTASAQPEPSILPRARSECQVSSLLHYDPAACNGFAAKVEELNERRYRSRRTEPLGRTPIPQQELPVKVDALKNPAFPGFGIPTKTSGGVTAQKLLRGTYGVDPDAVDYAITSVGKCSNTHPGSAQAAGRRVRGVGPEWPANIDPNETRFGRKGSKPTDDTKFSGNSAAATIVAPSNLLGAQKIGATSGAAPTPLRSIREGDFVGGAKFLSSNHLESRETAAGSSSGAGGTFHTIDVPRPAMVTKLLQEEALVSSMCRHGGPRAPVGCSSALAVTGNIIRPNSAVESLTARRKDRDPNDSVAGIFRRAAEVASIPEPASCQTARKAMKHSEAITAYNKAFESIPQSHPQTARQPPQQSSSAAPLSKNLAEVSSVRRGHYDSDEPVGRLLATEGRTHCALLTDVKISKKEMKELFVRAATSSQNSEVNFRSDAEFNTAWEKATGGNDAASITTLKFIATCRSMGV